MSSAPVTLRSACATITSDMAVGLVVEPRLNALEYRPPSRTNAVLEGFFAFQALARNFSTPTLLADCAFFDLSINYYMRDWPGKKHHPGIFGEFFPLILECLMEPGNVVTLFVCDWTTDYFEPRQHVAGQLQPRGLPYVFLPHDNIARSGSLALSEHLLFECPPDLRNYIPQWLYHGPFLETEGYVSKGPLLDLITRLYDHPDSEQTIRELLRATEFCFKAWPDGDGLFLLTDKLDLDALKRRLRLPQLNPLIEEAARRWDEQP